MKRSNFPQNKEAKRTLAEESQARWRSLTIDQQLQELKTRPGESKRQVARLLKLKALGHRIAQTGIANPKPVPQVEHETLGEKITKAPPRSDVRATRAYNKKRKNA